MVDPPAAPQNPPGSPPGGPRTPNAAGPIVQAVGQRLTEEHLSRIIEVGEKLAENYTKHGHEISKLNLWLNYAVIVVVLVVLGWLNLQGTLPAEALTGFLGTGIGYWLATSFQSSGE